MLTSLELPPTLLEQLQQFGMDLLDALDASRAVAASRTPKGREAAAREAAAREAAAREAEREEREEREAAAQVAAEQTATYTTAVSLYGGEQVWHPVWPPRVATPCGHPVWPPRVAIPCGTPVWPPRVATPCGTPGVIACVTWATIRWSSRRSKC